MSKAGDRREYRRNFSTYAAYSKEYQRANKGKLCDYQRSYHRRRKYGLSEDACQQILELQGNACAVCRTPLTLLDRFTIDHDHACCDSIQTCGKCIRGILCVNCNAGLGNFMDDADLMRLAIDYLEHGAAWCTQVGDRAKRLVTQMTTGEWQ